MRNGLGPDFGRTALKIACFHSICCVGALKKYLENVSSGSNDEGQDVSSTISEILGYTCLLFGAVLIWFKIILHAVSMITSVGSSLEMRLLFL